MLSSLIPLPEQLRIKRFVDVFIERCTDIAVVVPAVMRAGPPNSDGWTPWKPVDSPVTDIDVLSLENEFEIKFPPLFRAYLMYKCLLMTDFEVVLPETPFDDPLGNLRGYLELRSDAFFRERGLVPFAHDSNDAGPVCFDTRKPQLDGDLPVVLVDHGLMQNRSYNGKVIAASFAELLDRIEQTLLSYD